MAFSQPTKLPIRERTHPNARGTVPKVALLVLTGTVAFGLARSAPVAGQDEADTEAKIENAMSAAPSAISANATILDNELDDAGKFVVLREGSNGWSCFPDAPRSPGNDPQCLDQTWMDWLYAFVAGEEPNTTVPGWPTCCRAAAMPATPIPSPPSRQRARSG